MRSERGRGVNVVNNGHCRFIEGGWPNPYIWLWIFAQVGAKYPNQETNIYGNQNVENDLVKKIIA